MKLTKKQQAELIQALKDRFEANTDRHNTLSWTKVESKLKSNPKKLWVLHEMERTNGEPDVIDYNKDTNEYIFYDCVAESPKGRRSLCYDRKGLESRKEHRPKNTAIDMAKELGITLLTETDYRKLQELGDFDAKTSSWLETPASIRRLGGAIFGDYRFGTVFIYHNGAQSYYASRGFRGKLAV